MSNSTPAREVLNLGKIGEARLDLIPALSDCSPGIDPIEYNVVIAPAKTAEKIGSLFIPEDVQESSSLAMQVGRIIAMSPIAFNYDTWPKDAEPPKVGQLVWFARYAGAMFEGMDGQQYRIVKDKDIGAVVREAASSRISLVKEA